MTTNQAQPEETIEFTNGAVFFHVTMTNEGALKVILTGRGNGRLLILPESNTSATMHSENKGEHRKERRP